jgi:hypothetical protein
MKLIKNEKDLETLTGKVILKFGAPWCWKIINKNTCK